MDRRLMLVALALLAVIAVGVVVLALRPAPLTDGQRFATQQAVFATVEAGLSR